MLVEVKRELVKQDHRYLQKRFLQDALRRISIYIWQLPDDDEGEMLRFQISYKEIAIDWAAERGMRFASVDEGENPMGMKRSPVLNAEKSVRTSLVEQLCEHMHDYADKASLRFIREIIVRDVLQGNQTK